MKTQTINIKNNISKKTISGILPTISLVGFCMYCTFFGSLADGIVL